MKKLEQKVDRHTTSFITGLGYAAQDYYSSKVLDDNPIIKILQNRQPIPDNMTVWYYVYSLLHIHKYSVVPEINNSLINKKEERSLKGGYVKVNNIYNNYWLTELTRISIKNAYITEIIKFSKDNKCKLPNIHAILSYALELKDSLNNPEYIALNSFNEARYKLKYFINATYGIMINSDNSLLFFVNDFSELVSASICNILYKIEKKFP